MNKLVFICSTRDFHAIDWYKSAKKICKTKTVILTDSKSSEGLINLVNDKRSVIDLFIIDKFLFKKMSLLGNKWRNIVKLFFLPLQVILLKKFSKKNPECIYYAHSMYYLWMCHFAKVKFIGTPQGSEILVRTYKSRFYKYLSIRAIKSSLFITCDSQKMYERIYKISKKKPLIIQNGVDIGQIKKVNNLFKKNLERKAEIVSFRGLSELYRTKEILSARAAFEKKFKIPIRLIYPFSESFYKKDIISTLKKYDKNIGRKSKTELLKEFNRYLLYISIPKSDSSPRSVYECILSGGIVAITKEDYFYDLPQKMKERIIIVDLKDKEWLIKAYEKAKILNLHNFDLSKLNTNMFDQMQSFKKIYKELILITNRKKI